MPFIFIAEKQLFCPSPAPEQVMLISTDEMHLFVRSEEARSSPCKTLPGLAQLFVSKTCSSCTVNCALNSCALPPAGVFAGLFAVPVRFEQPLPVLLGVSPPALGSG